MPYAHSMPAEENLRWIWGLQHPESPGLNHQGQSPRKVTWIWPSSAVSPALDLSSFLGLLVGPVYQEGFNGSCLSPHRPHKKLGVSWCLLRLGLPAG